MSAVSWKARHLQRRFRAQLRDMDACRCGCPRDVHEHYRDGNDCGTCTSCNRYRRFPLVNDGFWGGWWAYFAPAGFATQPYWPPGTRGKLWNFLRGRDWRIT